MNYSRQREMIINYLKSTKEHPTAEQVYNFVRNMDSKISLGTVYRNLDKLSNEKIIKRLNFCRNKDRFDFDISNHMHGICIDCGKVFDIYENIDNLKSDIEKKEKCKIISYDVCFNTICQECSNKN